MQEKKRANLITKAIVYVAICDGNHIAAALLDWIYTYTEIFERVNNHEPYQIYVESAYGYLCDPGPYKEYLGYRVDVDGNLEGDLVDIRAAISSNFAQPCEITNSEIFNALDVLKNKYFTRYY